MGWTSYHATYYDTHGKIDRKKEIESQFSDGYSVVKSAMVGSVYYGAIRHGDDVFGLVVLTSTNARDYYNFGYKMMDETEGPYYNRCPKSILDLLTPTDSEFANRWRARCRENLSKPTKAQRLNALPIGTIIEIGGAFGGPARYIKNAPQFQFKRPWWRSVDRFAYISVTQIPDDFRIVERGA